MMKHALAFSLALMVLMTVALSMGQGAIQKQNSLFSVMTVQAGPQLESEQIQAAINAFAAKGKHVTPEMFITSSKAADFNAQLYPKKVADFANGDGTETIGGVAVTHIDCKRLGTVPKYG